MHCFFTRIAKLIRPNWAIPRCQNVSPYDLPLFEDLESRTLFSADSAAGLYDSLTIAEEQYWSTETSEQLILESEIGDSVSQNQSQKINVRQELIIIDSAVEDYDQFVKDIIGQNSDDRDFDIHIIDSQTNGIEQVANILKDYRDVDALHIVSHGTDGQVNLGNTWLGIDNLDRYSDSIAQWQNSFDQYADILIYGCNLASNADGQALTNALSDLTGADVSASIDDTGYSEYGGNWQLEYSTGNIETEIAFSEQIQEDWAGLLAYETYRDEFGTASFSNSDGSQDWSSSPWQEIGESNGVSAGNVQVSNKFGEQGLEIWQNARGVSRQVDLSSASNATVSFNYVRTGLDDASDFVVFEISANGGSTWTELDRFDGPANDTNLQYASYDISSHAASNTQIRFVSSGMTATESLFFDNFQIAFNENLSEKSEFLINGTDLDSQETSSENRGSHHAVATASDGSYVVVWTDVESTGDLSDVFARQYNADGTPKAGAFQVNSNSTNEQQWATVASDASGRFVVVWTSQDQDGDGQGIYLKRFSSNGSPIDGTDILVNSGNTIDNQTNPSVAVNSQGEMVITWENADPANRGIFAKTFDMTSAATGNQVPTSIITVNNAPNQNNPSVDINSEGKFVIAWQDGNQPHVQRFNSDGSLRGSQIDINPLATIAELYPVVAIQESGDFLVAYYSNVNPNKGVWIKHYNDDGSAKAIATKISSDVTHTSPSIAKDLEGNFIVVYEGAGDGDGNGVFARKYDSAANAIGTEFQINETTSGNQQMASIAMQSLENYIVVWSGNGSGDANGVFSRQFDTALSPGIMLSTSGDVASSGTPGITSWGKDTLLEVGDPSFSLEPSTNGSFLGVFDLVTNFAADPDVELTGLHMVTKPIVVGGTINLQNGDVLFTVNGAQPTLTSTNTLVGMNKSDIVRFRPDVAGDYSTGTFELVLNDPLSSLGVDTNLGGISLVQKSMSIGGQWVDEGDFLLVSAKGDDTIVHFFDVTTAGASTSGDVITLIEGADITVGLPNDFTSVHLVHETISIGGVTLTEGNVLVSLDTTTSDFAGLTTVEPQDVVALNVITAGTTTAATGTVIFDGSDINLDTGAESIEAFSTVASMTAPNNIPTLTTFAGTVDTTNEDFEVEITFADLTAQGDEADVDGTVDAFIVKSVSSGTLKIGTSAGTATAWAATTNDTLDATNKAYWTPDQDANGTLNAFEVVAEDDLGAESTGNITAQVNVSAQNDVPTLTTFAGIVDTTPEDTEVEITFADLTAQGDEADVDGSVDAFVVKAVSSGTLKIGTSAGTATAWAATTNDTINATNKAYWTPAQDANGTLNAFEVVAEDDQGAESIGNVTAQVNVTAQNDAPTLTTFAVTVDTTPEDTEVEITFANLAAKGDEADVDGSVDAFIVKTVSGGTLKIGTSAGTAPAWAAGTNDTIDSSNRAYWTPDLDANGTLNAFEVVAEDDQGAESTGNVTVQVEVTDLKLWLSTTGATSDNNSPVSSWNDFDIMSFDGPSLAFGENTTSGIFASEYSLQENIRAMHYVSAPTTVETGGGTPYDLQIGQIVLSFRNLVTLPALGGGTIDVDNKDIVVYSPSAGEYELLLDDPFGANIHALTIVEKQVTIGLDTTLNAGTYLFARSVPALHDNVYTYVGATAIETPQLLLDGESAQFGLNGSDQIQGLELLEEAVTIGGTNLAQGALLITVNKAATLNGGVSGDPQDIYALTVNSTLQDSVPDSIINASLFFDGDDVGLSGSSEEINAITLFNSNTSSNLRPTLTAFAGSVDATNEDTEVEITFADLTAQGDEADVDGTVDAFIVKSVSSGTLKIGASAGTASAWAAGSNDTIDATNKAYWTPNQDANGTLNAFDIVAEDDQGAESIGNVTAQVTVSAQNDVPTLTTFAGTVDTTPEDTEVEITFADLTAQGDEADVDGTVDAFIVKSVSSGTLKIGTSAGAAGAWAAGSNDTIDATNKAYWTPDPDASGTLNAFEVVAEDDQGAESIGNVTAQVNVTAQNDAPTLTTFAGTIDTTNEDIEVEITLADLTAQGDEADVDGTVDAFIVKTISTGTLKIGTSAGTASAWAAGTNDTIDATNKAYWTPAQDANGTLNAFQVVAEDDQGAESTGNVTAQVNVTAQNDAPTLTTFAGSVDTTNEDIEVEITLADLKAQGNEADVDGSVDAFVVKAVNSGTLKIGTSAGTATAWAATTNDTIDATNKAYWTPAQDANGTLNAFQVVAEDDQGAESTSNAAVQIDVASVNDSPNLSLATPLNVLENATAVVTVTATDPDGDSLTYSITNGADKNLFSIDPILGTLSWKNAPDFESPQDSAMDNDYEIEISANDNNGLSVQQTLNIIVNDVSGPPSLPNTNFNASENVNDGDIIGQLAPTSPDTDETFSYMLTGASIPGAFSIDSQGRIVVQNSQLLSLETNPTISLSVSVTDSQGVGITETINISLQSSQQATTSNTFGILIDDSSANTESQNKSEDQPKQDEIDTKFDQDSAEDQLNLSNFGIVISLEDVQTNDDSRTNTQSELSVFRLQFLEEQLNGKNNREHGGYSRSESALIDDIANGTGSSLSSGKKFVFSTNNNDFRDSLNRLRAQVMEHSDFEKTIVGSSVTVTTGLSIGYVVWLIRGGVLLSSVLSSLPAWRMIDPLPVITHLTYGKENQSDSNDSLESLIEKGKKLAKAKIKANRSIPGLGNP